MLDDWYKLPERYDNKLDAEYLKQQAYALTKYIPLDFKSQPYFSPSATDSCPRELYEKMRGAKRDVQARQPHQGRWTRLGTLSGDMLQRDLLFIEKYVTDAPFIPDRTDEGLPAWEDFAKKMHIIEHEDTRFSFFGKPDGILRHVPSNKRIGLEIKSKQTTAARTSLYSMKEPEAKHIEQCIAYGIMYDVSDYLIVYMNLSKKSWNMSDEDYASTPDLRVFHVEITDEMKQGLIERMASIVRASALGEAPPLDLSKWTFNNYKTACALSLKDEEYEDVKRQVERVKKSRMPDWKKRGYVEALEFIMTVREKGRY